jgi:hypothetical protein
MKSSALLLITVTIRFFLYNVTHMSKLIQNNFSFTLIHTDGRRILPINKRPSYMRRNSSEGSGQNPRGLLFRRIFPVTYWLDVIWLGSVSQQSSFICATCTFASLIDRWQGPPFVMRVPRNIPDGGTSVTYFIHHIHLGPQLPGAHTRWSLWGITSVTYFIHHIHLDPKLPGAHTR